MSRFPSPRMVLFLKLWSAIWTLGLPLILAYLFWRSLRDRDYRTHLDERFGRYATPVRDGIWIHAVSIGEVRSAVPLIRALLDRGDKVVVSVFTPAGRREALRALAEDIAAGRAAVVWVPLELDWCFRRFFAAFAPRAGLVMEIEIWPRMVAAARSAGLPLILTNAQYPKKSFDRDRTRLRGQIVPGVAAVFAKSELQARRFRELGAPQVVVTGELRFDQPIPEAQVTAAVQARRWLGATDRPVVTIASAIAGEDATYLEAIARANAAHDAAGQPRPLIVYVPRAPERFDEVARTLAEAGHRVACRSACFDEALQPAGGKPEIDILLGDSFGEMYFYLALADRAVTGGGYVAKGAHNVIEPLALRKPVIVGPHVWTIEYPAVEAIDAGVLKIAPDATALADALSPPTGFAPGPGRIEDFFVAHSGATERTLAALDALMSGVD